MLVSNLSDNRQQSPWVDTCLSCSESFQKMKVSGCGKQLLLSKGSDLSGGFKNGTPWQEREETAAYLQKRPLYWIWFSHPHKKILVSLLTLSGEAKTIAASHLFTKPLAQQKQCQGHFWCSSDRPNQLLTGAVEELMVRMLHCTK